MIWLLRNVWSWRGEIKKSLRSPNYFYLLDRHPKTSLPEVKRYYLDGGELLAEGGQPATCWKRRQHFNSPSVSIFHAKKDQCQLHTGGIILVWLCKQKREWDTCFTWDGGSSKSREGYSKLSESHLSMTVAWAPVFALFSPRTGRKNASEAPVFDEERFF